MIGSGSFVYKPLNAEGAKQFKNSFGSFALGPNIFMRGDPASAVSD
jgi:hypothetical protein